MQWGRALRRAVALGCVVVLASACGPGESPPASAAKTRRSTLPASSGVSESRFGPAPEVPSGPLAAELARSLDAAFGEDLADGWGPLQADALQAIAASEDARLAWVLADLMRVSSGDLLPVLGLAAADLLGGQAGGSWNALTNRLIAWDVPAPPDYLAVKRRIFTLLVPEWEPLFAPGAIDWRLVTWGGVRIDDRPFGTTDTPCPCIPAADNPAVTDVDGASWLDDEDVVFGIEINGATRAYPRRILEVREMINDTLGGRDLGIPYCTLCGSAQAYFTDAVPEGVARPVLRTSGLLIRSNKVMYDLETFSVFDTFRGHAVTGPLAERGIVLPQAGVVTTRWGDWKAAHPETTVLAEALALGRDPDFRNTRDANGPIFPIGDVDPRLPVQEEVLGVVTASGQPIAFPVERVHAALRRGEAIVFENVHLVLDGGGLRAVDASGEDLGAHQAFWFAWSQFHPGSALWPDADAS